MNNSLTSSNPAHNQTGRSIQRRSRSRLLRRTFLIALLLVSIGLVSSGVLELFFRYCESVEAIWLLQREMAQGAAFKIQQFVQDIEKTLRASTQTPDIVASGITEAYRFELIKLLKTAPAITTVIALDAEGREQLKVSRVQMVLSEDLQNRASSEAFTKARSGKTFFSPVYFVRESEPYMTITVPIEPFAREVIGVLMAEVNLKYIWEVIAQIKVGLAGYAYVVSQEGDLIAYPDISMVLQKRNLKDLGQVQAALAGAPGPFRAQSNLAGQPVFPAYALIPDLGWVVLVERPAREAYAPLYSSLLRTSLLLLAGLGMAVVASLRISRRVVHPVEALRQGAERIGAGALNHRIAVRTGDELEELAEQFNSMAAHLQESYAHLEHRVEERTRDLAESLEQQTATSEILRIIASSPTDLQSVLDAVAEYAARLCEANNALIFRIEDEVLRMVASYGPLQGPLREERIPINHGWVTGRAVIDRQTIHVHDLATVNETEFPLGRTHQQRFGHRTILSTPLLREGHPLGVITIRRMEVRPFTDKQIKLLETFADQAVIAIENARLFQELQERTRELTRLVAELQALGEVGQAVNSTLDLQTVLDTIVTRAVGLSEADGGAIFEYDEQTETFHLRATQKFAPEFIEILQSTPLRLGEGAIGRAAVARAPLQIPDVLAEGAYAGRLREVVVQSGFRALLAVPLLREDRVMGGLVVLRKAPGAFPAAVVALL